MNSELQLSHFIKVFFSSAIKLNVKCLYYANVLRLLLIFAVFHFQGLLLKLLKEKDTRTGVTSSSKKTFPSHQQVHIALAPSWNHFSLYPQKDIRCISCWYKNTHCITVTLNGQDKSSSRTLEQVIQRGCGILILNCFQDSARQNQGWPDLMLVIVLLHAWEWTKLPPGMASNRSFCYCKGFYLSNEHHMLSTEFLLQLTN